MIDQKASEDTHLIAYHSGMETAPYYINLYFPFRGSIPVAQTYHRSGQATLQGTRKAQYECSVGTHRTEVQTARRETGGLPGQNVGLWPWLPGDRQKLQDHMENFPSRVISTHLYIFSTIFYYFQ